MDKKRKIGLLFVIIGTAIVLWSGYGWWVQANSVIIDSEKAQSIDEEWDDTNKQKTIILSEEKVSGDNKIDKALRYRQQIMEREQQKNTEKQDDTKQAAPFGQEGVIGKLTIPKMGKIFPVFFGTDPHSLSKGVGMYDTPSTVYPNENGHTALAGHRDTVFIGLDELTEGDKLYLEVDGEKYEYQIRKTWITDAEDRTVIVKKERPTLTLTTCYPFDFVGSAPDRYIVQSELISTENL
ncbi:class D sortase [Aquibacillus sediminis]|uniref:class D sortase n=1 Tax=Aquibacillus sediminis TaxID=2574734 RepID=UPI001FE32004|nr:class D sortase [Aquibacillus sediminis]